MRTPFQFTVCYLYKATIARRTAAIMYTNKRYSLRNNEETLKLKQILFFRTKAEMDAYHDMSCKPEDWTEAEIEQQRSRFCSVWQVIEEAELVDEYEAWKEANPNA